MLELGVNEIMYHISLAKNLHLCSLDIVHCVGTRMRSCYDVLPVEIRGDWVKTAEEFKSKLQTMIMPGDMVLVKGSLGSNVSTIVDPIRKLGQR
jgi:UDP-N-acetylmuramoyl-tripeptide--D-alanyl-D-alanine ligase